MIFFCPPLLLIYEVFVLFFTFVWWHLPMVWLNCFFVFFCFQNPSRSIHSSNHVLVIVMVRLFEMGTSLVSHVKVNMWTVRLSWLIVHLWPYFSLNLLGTHFFFFFTAGSIFWFLFPSRCGKCFVNPMLYLRFLCDVFRIRARTLEIASHGVLWGWFEPQYCYLFKFL